MKLLFLTVCLSVLTTQIYSEESIAEILDICETQLSDEDLNRFHKYFHEIKGIRWVALDDLRSLTKQHCALLYPLANFALENIIREMNGRDVLITTEDWHKYLQTWGFQQSDLDEILKRVDNIPSDKLDSDRKARLLTLLKGTKHEATLDDVKAAHDYLLLCSNSP